MKNLKTLVLWAVFAMITIGINDAYSQNGFRVVSGHPDFKVKVIRCAASGTTCVIDMIVENISSRDVNIGFLADWTIAYDDEANQYSTAVSLNSKPATKNYYKTLLPANVPLKARIQIDGLVPSATMFRRIDVNFYSDDWQIGIGDIGWGMMSRYNKRVQLLNVPITHDGDR